MPPQLWPQQVPQATVLPQQYSASPASGSDEIRSLWIGDLQPWMDEPYINTCFFNTGEVLESKSKNFFFFDYVYVLFICFFDT